MGEPVWFCCSPLCVLPSTIVTSFGIVPEKWSVWENLGDQNAFSVASVALLNVLYIFKQKHSVFVLGLSVALLCPFTLASQISCLEAKLPTLCKEMQMFSMMSKHRLLYLLLIHLSML